MKTWPWTCLFGTFVLVWWASAVLSSSNDTCNLSTKETEKWKGFIVNHPKLIATLSDVLSQELKNICDKPGLQNPPLSIEFGAERIDFTINPASSSYKPFIPKSYPSGPAPVNIDNYPAVLAYKTFVSVRDSNYTTVTDFDNVVFNSMEAFDGKSGIFTAPVSGLYFLAYSQVKPRNMVFVQVGFQKPGSTDKLLQMSKIEAQYNLDAWGSTGLQMIVRLEKGEQVRIIQYVFYGEKYFLPPSTLEWEAFLDRSRMFTAFLLPNTTYWNGISPFPYANAFPAFTANIHYDFNADNKNDVDLFYENVYESEQGVMNAKSGVFTAKIRGIYYFSFSAIKGPQSKEIINKNLVEVLKNKREVVAATFCDGAGAGTGPYTYLPNFAQVTLLLEAGDTINAVLRYGRFHVLIYFELQPSIGLTGFLVVPVPKEPNAIAASYPVFNAHRSALVGMNKTKVTFDLVTVNQGGNFNGQAGVFVAPVKGYYFFSYRDTTLKSSRYTVAKMLRNSEVVATAHIHSGDGQTWMVTTISTTVFLPLSPGDQVYVEQFTIGTGDTSTTEGRSNVTIVFTGFLLNSIK